MRKLSKSIISKLLLVVGLIITFTGVIMLVINSNQSAPSQGEVFARVVQSGYRQVLARWENGDLENQYPQGKFSCSDLIFNSQLVDSEFFKCNPHYLECYLSGKAGNRPQMRVKYRSKVYHLEFLSNPKFVTVTKNDSVKIQVKVKELDEAPVTLELMNTCRDVYLPQRIYSAGDTKQENLLWDNFGRHFFLDRFYVSNQDVYLWAKTFGLKEIPINEDPKYWFFPSTNLTLKQRHQYCQSYGKRLLQSRFLDAASYLPSDLKDSRPEYIYKHPYPWSKGKKNVFLYLARMDKDFMLSKDACGKSYVKGCDNLRMYRFYATDSATWMGLYFPLGNFMESVTNKFNAFQNLKASSIDFTADSLWHEIGKRAFWDGQGFELSHFEFKEHQLAKDILPPAPAKQYQVAFRCMKQREVAK
jgi:hypothetical protein